MHALRHLPLTAKGSLQLTLAAAVMMSTQAVLAADEVSIIPGQRQLTVDKPGILTLRFEVTNRSGQAQQLQENLILPPDWELVTNTAPFLLANGSRDVRLVHVLPPKGLKAGTYNVQYMVSAQGGGGLGSSQSVSIRVEGQSGINLTAVAPPSSLLGGEQYSVEFLLENTGNRSVTYKLSGTDEEGYIRSVEPRRLTLAAGESGTVTVSGAIPRQLDATSAYRISLDARGGGKQASESVTIPLIARVPQGVGKYQTLAGKLTNRYSQQQREAADGTKTDQAQWQAEYHAQGAIDTEGKHHIDLRVRNGQNSTATYDNSNQQAEYQLNYRRDDITLNTGHRTFSTHNQLSGNSLAGIGAEATYRPRNDDNKQPLTLQAFHGQSRSEDSQQEKVTGSSVQYQWDEFDMSASLLQHEKAVSPTQENMQKQTVAAVGAGWRGNNISARTEVAADDDAHAWSIDVNGQWQKLGVNASVLKAEPLFDGSSTDTSQTFANAHYQLSDTTSVTASTRKTLNNLDKNPSQEIREDREHEARISRTFGDARQVDISLGHRQRQEQDLRPAPTTDREISATTLTYNHRFDDISVRAAVEQGKREDRTQASSKGNKRSLAVNWQATSALNLNADASISDDLDSAGKSTSAGVNGTLKLNKRNQLTGHAQRNKNNSEKTHADSLEVKYTHDLKKFGSIGASVRRTDNQATDGSMSHDNLAQLEYSVPLDVPIRKRNNIGSVRGKVHFAENQQPASDVVVQMGGQYAVTDTKGEFHYPNVIAKEYQVQIDGSRPNTQGYMLSQEGAEARVTVKANQTAQPDLSLHPSSRISGKLQTYTHDAAAAVFDTSGTEENLRADKGIGRTLIELQPVGEVGKRIVHKRTTLHDGSFSFVGIPPGQWKLVIVDSNQVPANYRLEQTEFLLDLDAGTNKTLQLRALPSAQGIKRVGPSSGFNVSG